jgi:hypothetical protein
MHTPLRICWICNIKDEKLAIDLATKLNLMKIKDESISAQKELQDPEFCTDYRTGQCKQTRCHFDHVPCTSRNSIECPPECPKGHQKGTKEENVDIPSDSK